MATQQSASIKWKWLFGVSLRMAGIIVLGMLLGEIPDVLVAFIGGVVPITDHHAFLIESRGKTLFQLTGLATAILYGILSAR